MFTALLVILAIAYIVLKVSNTRADFARKDAEMARREQEAREAMEEEAEEEEIRAAAIDVEADTIDIEDLDAAEFEVEPPAEADAVPIEVPEFETVE